MIDGKERLIDSSVSKEIETNVLAMTRELEKSVGNDDLQVKIVETYIHSIKEDIENKKVTIDDLL